MVIEENWGIPLPRAQAFFRAQADIREDAAGFSCGQCRVTLTAVPPDPSDILPLSRTLLRIEGEETASREIRRRFFLQFLSAGG